MQCLLECPWKWLVFPNYDGLCILPPLIGVKGKSNGSISVNQNDLICFALCPSCTAFRECSPIQSGVFQIKQNYRHETDGAQVERSKVAKALCKESERYLKRLRSMRAGLTKLSVVPVYEKMNGKWIDLDWLGTTCGLRDKWWDHLMPRRRVYQFWRKLFKMLGSELCVHTFTNSTAFPKSWMIGLSQR